MQTNHCVEINYRIKICELVTSCIICTNQDLKYEGPLKFLVAAQRKCMVRNFGVPLISISISWHLILNYLLQPLCLILVSAGIQHDVICQSILATHNSVVGDTHCFSSASVSNTSTKLILMAMGWTFDYQCQNECQSHRGELTDYLIIIMINWVKEDVQVTVSCEYPHN